MRKAKDSDHPSISVSTVRYSQRDQVVSGVVGPKRSYPLFELGVRIFIITAWIIIVVALAFLPTAIAEPSPAHTDIELRLGGGVLNGTDSENEEGLPRTIKMTAQIFADRLFPVTTVGNGVFEIGPYGKGALLDGVSIPQVAGGAIVGYRLDKYEILINVGLAYATERIGENTSDRVVHPGQTKQTYDLGLSLRYDLNQYFISAGYQHNSNGSAFDIDFLHQKGSNPGYDNVFAGVGIRF